MNLVVDTSVILAVVTNEAHKQKLIDLTRNADLLAPSSVPWEIGNAFSAMFKRRRISLEEARNALLAYQQIPIQFSDVELEDALELSDRLDIYAYDAYMITCAQKHACALISLDTGLLNAANRAGVTTLEIKS